MVGVVVGVGVGVRVATTVAVVVAVAVVVRVAAVVRVRVRVAVAVVVVVGGAVRVGGAVESMSSFNREDLCPYCEETRLLTWLDYGSRGYRVLCDECSFSFTEDQIGQKLRKKLAEKVTVKSASDSEKS